MLDRLILAQTYLASHFSSSRDKVLILWDLNIHSSVRVVPTFECVEAMIGVPYGSPYPSIKAVGGTHLYAVTAGERGITLNNNEFMHEWITVLLQAACACGT